MGKVLAAEVHGTALSGFTNPPIIPDLNDRGRGSSEEAGYLIQSYW